MVSPEDADWADSCLTTDPDMLDGGWDSLKEALLETLDTQNNPPPHERDDSTEMEIFSKVDTPEGRDLVRTAIDNSSEGPESGVRSNNEDTGDFWSSHRMEDIFLPTYDENSRDLGPAEAGFVFPASELEQSAGDIFKVWDLDIPPEEDGGLIKQLDKALAGDTRAWEGLQDFESFDDIISGIADLTLSRNTG